MNILIVASAINKSFINMKQFSFLCGVCSCFLRMKDEVYTAICQRAFITEFIVWISWKKLLNLKDDTVSYQN